MKLQNLPSRWLYLIKYRQVILHDCHQMIFNQVQYFLIVTYAASEWMKEPNWIWISSCSFKCWSGSSKVDGLWEKSFFSFFIQGRKIRLKTTKESNNIQHLDSLRRPFKLEQVLTSTPTSKRWRREEIASDCCCCCCLKRHLCMNIGVKIRSTLRSQDQKNAALASTF